MAKRILIVDDEADFSELLQFRLRNCQYEILAAASGAEALDKARFHQPDVILMDLLLPDLDGLTLCEILRRQHATRETPIIMISSLTTEVTRHSAKLAGASAFLSKPLDFAGLKAHLESLLTESRSGGLGQNP
jgi:DNA-binding response OmpR family regulator